MAEIPPSPISTVRLDRRPAVRESILISTSRSKRGWERDSTKPPWRHVPTRFCCSKVALLTADSSNPRTRPTGMTRTGVMPCIDASGLGSVRPTAWTTTVSAVSTTPFRCRQSGLPRRARVAGVRLGAQSLLMRPAFARCHACGRSPWFGASSKARDISGCIAKSEGARRSKCISRR